MCRAHRCGALTVGGLGLARGAAPALGMSSWRRAAGPVILPWRAPPVRELPMRYCKAHTTPCHPRQSLELVKLEGSSATPQHGGPAPCHQGRADRLSVDSRLARAAAPPQPPPPAVQGRTKQRVSSPKSCAGRAGSAVGETWRPAGALEVPGGGSEALAHK